MAPFVIKCLFKIIILNDNLVHVFLPVKGSISRLEISCITTVLIGVGILFDFQLAEGLLGQIIALVGAAFAGLTVTLIRTLLKKTGR